MIVYQKGIKFGFNQHGTVYISCPYCDEWWAATHMSAHCRIAHPKEVKAMQAQARKASK